MVSNHTLEKQKHPRLKVDCLRMPQNSLFLHNSSFDNQGQNQKEEVSSSNLQVKPLRMANLTIKKILGNILPYG
jgi:hypothetical protein